MSLQTHDSAMHLRTARRGRSTTILLAAAAALWLSAPPIGQLCADDATPAKPAPVVGPPKGSLLVHGGGKLSKAVMQRFIELAGGPDALIVVIPTAGTADEFPADWSGLKPLETC